MNKRTAVLHFCLCLVLFSTGCANKYSERSLAIAPAAESIAAISDYAQKALDATGGLDRWLEAKELRMEAIVTLYRADGSTYLTEHRYEVYPWSNSIRITTREPSGIFSWLLSRGQVVEYNAPDANGPADPLNANVPPKDFAELVLDISTAGVRFLDSAAAFEISSEPVKIDTHWYYAISRVPAHEGAMVENVTFYQNLTSGVVEAVEAPSEGDFYLARSYNYEKAEPAGVLVPTKIEIFRTDALRVSRHRLVTIDLTKLAALTEVDTYSHNRIIRWFEKRMGR
jgi:hypothetical protein